MSNNVDRLFDTQPVAVDLFTDRVDEHAAFIDSVYAHLDRVLNGGARLDDTARRNVLTYYGIGGIGKTELSRRLEAWIQGRLQDTNDWGPGPQFDHDLRTVRLDFHGSHVLDPVDILLKIRAAVADHGRRFPAFDIGLTSWWILARPSTPLPALAGVGGLDVRKQIIDTLAEALAEAGMQFGLGPFTVRTVSMFIDAARTRRIRSKTLERCPYLGAFLDMTDQAASPEVASALSGLLTWDLEQLLPSQQPLAIVFADACEYIQGGNRIHERLINRIVFLTPSMLWVMTSQESLDWHGRRLTGLLAKHGPDIWPGLCLDSDSEPRQHRVGDLSDTDVRRFLHSASGTGGNPVLPEEVMEAIRSGAHGVPLYLDLALSIARTINGPLTPEAFGHPLPILVSRIFANLPPSERDVARTVSLLPRFDVLLASEASRRNVADAERLCRRAMISIDDHPLFPYRMHDSVRRAIIAEQPEDWEGWSEVDRQASAARIVEVLRTRHDHRGTTVQQRRLVLELVARLCADYDLRPLWFLPAVISLPGERQTAEFLPPPALDTWIGQLSAVFHTWPNHSVAERSEKLEQLAGQRLHPEISRLTRRYLAFAIRDRGQRPSDHEYALSLLRELLAESPQPDDLSLHIARLLTVMRRYEELENHLRERSLGHVSAENLIRGDIAFRQGKLDEAAQAVAARAQYTESIGEYRLSMENKAICAWRKALNRNITAAECDTVIADTERYGMWLQLRMALAAKAVCLAGDAQSVRITIDEMQAIVGATKGRYGWRERSAAVVHALRIGDAAAVARLYEPWTVERILRTPHQEVLDRLFAAGGYPRRFATDEVAGDDAALVDRRWTAKIQRLILA